MKRDQLKYRDLPRYIIFNGESFVTTKDAYGKVAGLQAKRYQAEGELCSPSLTRKLF